MSEPVCAVALAEVDCTRGHRFPGNVMLSFAVSLQGLPESGFAVVQTSMAASRLPSGTILSLPAATHRPQPQHPHSSCLSRSPPRTVAAHLVLPPAVDLVTTMTPAQIDPNAACISSSQPPSSRCCAGIEPSVGSVGDSYDYEKVGAAWKV
jgi:hypothetical protein